MQLNAEKWCRWCVFPLLAVLPIVTLGMGYGLFLVPLPIVGLSISYAMVTVALLLLILSFAFFVVLEILLINRGKLFMAFGGALLYVGTYAIVLIALVLMIRTWVF